MSEFALPEGLPAPAATPDGLDSAYWQGTRRHELWVQRCNDCGAHQWGPEWICHRCLSFDVGWAQVSGRGRIYSWERVWHPVHPALKDHGPYIVALVELPDAENVRVIGNLLGDPEQPVKLLQQLAARVHIGSRPFDRFLPPVLLDPIGVVPAGLGPVLRPVRCHHRDQGDHSRGGRGQHRLSLRKTLPPAIKDRRRICQNGLSLPMPP